MLTLALFCLLAYGTSRVAGYVNDHTEHGRQLGASIRSFFDH